MMVSPANSSCRERLRLGLVAWPQPLWAFLCTLMAFGIALASVSLAGTAWIVATILFFACALSLVGAKSRGYVEMSNQRVRIAPKGDMGRKVAYPRAAIRAIEVGEGATLVFVFVAGGSQSFGPWVTAWGRPTGMRERCQSVVDAFGSSFHNE